MIFKEISETITVKEWRFITIMTVVIIIITSIPYLYGYFITSPENFYTGIHTLAPGDQHVYYSYIEQVKQGHFLFKDLYTTEEQGRIIFNPLWLGVGLLARAFNLSNIFAFHLARVLLIPFLAIILYFLMAYFFRDKIKRKIGYLFLLFSSGLGGLLAPYLQNIVYEFYGYYHWPMDLWVPEANVFLTMYQSPHYVASLTLIVAIFLIFLIIFNNPQGTIIKYSLIAGVCGLVLFQFHPFHVPTVFGVLFAYIIVETWRRPSRFKFLMKPFLIFTLVSLPSIFYYFFMMKYDPLTAQRAIQNVCLTPVWWLTLIGYGLTVPLAIASLFNPQIRTKKYLFLIIWLIVQGYLIFSSFIFQRRLSEGLQIPLTILALAGLFFLYDFFKQKNNPRFFKKWIDNIVLGIFLFIFLFAFSTIFNLARDVYFYQEQKIFYWPREYKEAFMWFKANTPEEASILTHQTTGNLIPGISGRFVYLGHEGVETLFFHPKNALVHEFFRDNQDDEGKKQFLEDNGIDYIFYSVFFEKSLGDYEPNKKDYLEGVYRNQEVAIYRVK